MTGFKRIAYTRAVQAEQVRRGSRAAMQRSGGGDAFVTLSDDERDFIAMRDEFYLATVNGDGWPYIQYKSGPVGFISSSCDGTTLRYDEVAGNRQFITFGNIADNDRVALFFIDYARRLRLKVFGTARLCDVESAGGIDTQVQITVHGSDWNCPKSIIQRFDIAQVRRLLDLTDNDGNVD